MSLDGDVCVVAMKLVSFQMSRKAVAETGTIILKSTVPCMFFQVVLSVLIYFIKVLDCLIQVLIHFIYITII